MLRTFNFWLFFSLTIYCGESTVLSDSKVNECDYSQSELKLVFIHSHCTKADLMPYALSPPLYNDCADYLKINLRVMQRCIEIHRHGARTPVEKTMPYVTDKEKVKCRTDKEGLGQLTREGIRNGYELGKFFEKRYGPYTSCHYNQSVIDIHSTNSARTKMTIGAALAVLFPPPKDNWSEDIDWTPTPYSTCKTKNDPLLAIYNCPKFSKKFMKNLKSPVPGMEEYDELLCKLSDIFGKDLESKHAMCYVVHDALVSQEHLGIPLTREVKKLMPELKECANDVLHYLLAGDDEDLALQTGVLLKEFFDAADQIQLEPLAQSAPLDKSGSQGKSAPLGKSGPIVYIKSAHDINVAALMYAAGVPSIEVPKYTSAFALEVRQVKKTGKYVVCPIYQREPGVKEKWLKVRGCVGACGYQTFKALTAKYVMDEDTRSLKCGITLDFLKKLFIDIENSFI